MLTQALVPSVAANTSVPTLPAIEPLKVMPLSSVNVSTNPPPASASTEVIAMLSSVTAFVPVMLQAFVAF